MRRKSKFNQLYEVWKKTKATYPKNTMDYFIDYLTQTGQLDTIKDNFDGLLDYYVINKVPFGFLTNYVPDTIAKNFNKVFDYYVRNKFRFNYLAKYIPDTIAKNFDKVSDYYVSNKFRFNYLARYIPDTITKNLPKVEAYYESNGWDIDTVLNILRSKL